MNILFTCAGRRNYLLNYFRAENVFGNIIAADLSVSAPAMAAADIALTVPRVEDSKYIAALIEIIRDYEIQLLISLNDLELPILSKSKDKLNELGCRVLVSDEHVIDTCFDKLKTNDFAKNLGISVPTTYSSIDSVKAHLSKGILDFPLVIKPRWGSSSIGIEFPEDEYELELAYNLLNRKLDRTILKDVSTTDREKAIIIQEKVNGTEFGLDIINDLNGEHQAVIVKKKIAMRAGETDKAMTIDRKDLQQLGRQIGENLKHIVNLDCDFFEDDNDKLYLLEMNPRFGGGYPFSHEAGVNLPKAIFHWLNGEVAPKSCFQAKINMAFSKCDYLVHVNYK